jgi:hypothetical protein
MTAGTNGNKPGSVVHIDRWTVLGVGLIASTLIVLLLWLGHDWIRIAGALIALFASIMLAAMARPALLAVAMLRRNRAERRELLRRLDCLEREHGLQP